MSTIQKCDSILVIQKGKMIEQGNHSQLVAQYPKGIYVEMVQRQFYQEEEEKLPVIVKEEFSQESSSIK